MHEIRTLAKKWRYACPEGHTNWYPINGHFRCRSCAKHAEAGADVDPEFHELHDKQTGAALDRDQIRLDTRGRA